MLAPFIICFREGIEIFLVIIPLVVYFNKNKMFEMSKSVALGGILGGFTAAIIGSIIFSQAALLNGPAGELFDGILGIILAGLVLYSVVLLRKSKFLKTTPNQQFISLSKKGVFIIAAITAAIIYLLFCILKYKNSLKRLKKISFWLSFIVIAFASSFLWNGFSHGVFFSMDGLIVGLKMNARAIIIVIGFASISVELRNPVIKSVLYHRGFANLYQSLNLAFSALPFFISNISSKSKSRKGISGKTFHSIIGQAETLFYKFEKEHMLKPQVVIITGEIQQGKTTFTQNIISELKRRRIKVAGFFSIGIDENGIRNGFNLSDIETGKLIELCSDKKDEKRLRLGRFYFNPEALSLGNEILKPANIADKQLIVIDEIGPLEVKGQGWCRAIDDLTVNFTIPQLWVVRKSLVQKISRKWNIGDAYIFDIADSTTTEVVEKLSEIISKND